MIIFKPLNSPGFLSSPSDRLSEYPVSSRSGIVLNKSFMNFEHRNRLEAQAISKTGTDTTLGRVLFNKMAASPEEMAPAPLEAATMKPYWRPALFGVLIELIIDQKLATTAIEKKSIVP